MTLINKGNETIYYGLQSVNAVTPGCKSSDEILVKNSQNLLQTVLRGVHAAETACITVNYLHKHTATNLQSNEVFLRDTYYYSCEMKIPKTTRSPLLLLQGLKQPEPNSDGEEATALCFQWKRNLEIHRAQQTSNLETDDLGLRKTSSHPVAPSLAPPVHVKGGYK